MGLFDFFRPEDVWAAKRVATARLLHDGVESEQLYRDRFSIPLSNGAVLSESINTLAQVNFDDAKLRMPPDLRASLITQCGFERSRFHPDYWMDRTVGIGPKICLRPATDGQQYLILSAYGETQPSRYMLVLCGVWLFDPATVSILE